MIATAISHKPRQEVLRDCGILASDLLEALPAALYLTDATGHLTFYNRAAADLWGWCPDLGSARWCGSWRLFWPDGTPLAHDRCPMAVAIQQNRQVRGVVAQAERPDGARVPFAPFPTPLRDADGKLLGAVNLLMAISDDCNSEVARRGGPSPQWVRREAEHRTNNLLLAILPIASRLRADTATPRRHPSGRARALALQIMEENGFGIERAGSRVVGRGLEVRSRRSLGAPEAVGGGSLALEDGPALFLEGANSLPVVGAVVDHPAQPLYPLESLRSHRVGAGQDPQLLLHHRNAQRRVGRDLPC